MDLPHLPANSFLWRHFLEDPWLAGFVLLASAALTLWIAVRLVRRVLMIVGLTLLTLCAGVFVLSRIIETPAERLVGATEEMVRAAIMGDDVRLGSMLSEDVRVMVGGQPTRLGKQEILSGVAILPRWVQSNVIRKRAAHVKRWSAETGETVFAQTTTVSNQPTPNSWRVQWKRNSRGEWQVTELSWEKINITGTPTSEILKGF